MSKFGWSCICGQCFVGPYGESLRKEQAHKAKCEQWKAHSQRLTEPKAGVMNFERDSADTVPRTEQ